MLREVEEEAGGGGVDAIEGVPERGDGGRIGVGVHAGQDGGLARTWGLEGLVKVITEERIRITAAGLG